MHDVEWRFAWKAIDKLGGALGIGQRATWESAAHLHDVCVHTWPIETEAQAMKSSIGIEMSTNEIGMKGNEEDVVEFL